MLASELTGMTCLDKESDVLARRNVAVYNHTFYGHPDDLPHHHATSGVLCCNRW